MGCLLSRAAILSATVLGLAACALTRTALAPGQRFPVFFTNAVVIPDAPGVGVVDAAANWAKRYPSEQITVTGYADPRAAEHVAERLATRRADEIAALLEERGVSPDRIKRSIGDEALIGMSGVGNRRVDIAVGM
jgi:outer membrane protein OmpA-like peptidoglycan-associated protein